MKTKSIAGVAFFTLFLCLLMANIAGATNYTLTVIAQGSGSVLQNPTNTSYPANVTVTLTALPSASWYFANWSGNASGSVNPLNVMMTGNLVITGSFLAYPTYSLALATNGQGGIALSPPGGSYQSNTMVTATATASAGWVFAGWSGETNSGVNPVSIAVNTNGTLTGTFAQLPSFDIEPVSVTNKSGSTVSFTAHSMGTGPLEYQWYFSGGSLTTITTNTTLSLTNIGTSQAGSYWAVATNNYGSATSQVVSLTLTNSTGPTNIVASPNQASLQAAIALGGWVGFGFNGTLMVTNTITITNNVVLDGSGVAATISGGNAVRLFYVTNGASLTISNLTLANGYCVVTNGVPGTPADAGAIYNNGGNVTLANCTLTNNAAESLVYGGLARGGAIFNNGGIVSLYQSLIISNQVVGGGPYTTNFIATIGTALGGAIYNTNGTVTINACTVNGNLAQSVCEFTGTGLTMGGGVFQSSGAMTVLNSSLVMNQALGGAGGHMSFPGLSSPAYGGALAANGGSVTIGHVQFVANVAAGGSSGYDSSGGSGLGGAIYSAAALTVTDSSLFSNEALAGLTVDGFAIGSVDGLGGAIYNSGIAALNRCVVYSNYAQGGITESYQFESTTGFRGLGGGIFNASQLAATNCTIALNSAAGGSGEGSELSGNGTTGNAIGGGVFNNTNATFVAMNLTIASNSCSSPSGYYSTTGFVAGFQIANATNGTFSVHNTLIAYSGTNSNAYGPITDDGYNICSDGSAGLFSGSSYNYTDPQLGPLGNYGGPTLCMALLPTSPAIDNGDPSDFPATDQRGYIRPFGSGPDMGAYEYGSAPSTVPYLSMGVSGTNVMLSFAAFPTNTYYLQWSTNLATWNNLSTNGPFAVSTDVSQTVSGQGLNLCFFRLLLK